MQVPHAKYENFIPFVGQACVSIVFRVYEIRGSYQQTCAVCLVVSHV